jgi:hypothetical protein
MTKADLERVDPSTVAEAVRAENKEIAVVDVRNSEVSSCQRAVGSAATLKAVNCNLTPFCIKSAKHQAGDGCWNALLVELICCKRPIGSHALEDLSCSFQIQFELYHVCSHVCAGAACAAGLEFSGDAAAVLWWCCRSFHLDMSRVL